MTKIPTIEETLDEVEKHWDTDRTEATRAIMRYASGQRTALLTELREWSVKQDWPVSKRDEGLAFQEKLGHNEAHEDLQTHLDELINPTK